MPIYEYECSRCGDVIEVIQKFSDKPLTRHKSCGGRLARLISRSAFHLKGDGWYVTDYARKGKQEGTDDQGTKVQKVEKSDKEASSESSAKGSETKSGDGKKAEGKPHKTSKAGKAGD